MNLGKVAILAKACYSVLRWMFCPFSLNFLLLWVVLIACAHGVQGAQVIKELTAIRDKCLSHGIRPIFLTPPPINPKAIHQAFNEETTPDWQAQFAAVNYFIRQQRYNIDIEPYFMNADHELPIQYATDGPHLDIEGKKLMALVINANWNRVTK